MVCHYALAETSNLAHLFSSLSTDSGLFTNILFFLPAARDERGKSKILDAICMFRSRNYKHRWPGGAQRGSEL